MTEWIFVTSSASSGLSRGRIDGSRLASMLLPDPGGPTSSRLWPPAAAISRARLAFSCPLTSAKSGSGVSRGSGVQGGAGSKAFSPVRWQARLLTSGTP